MSFALNFSYGTAALLAAVRITLWFILLFGFIAPLFLSYTRKLPAIEKLIYSWTGLGGMIIFLVFVLTSLQVYDFISFSVTLLMIPVIITFLKSDKRNPLTYLKEWEQQVLIKHIRLIERANYRSFRRLLKIKLHRLYTNWKKERSALLVLAIAITGGMTRVYPALKNAAPFSRQWFWDLDRIKSLHLQDYFAGSFEPAGMHSLVSIFSMLTQISPEMILHLLGGLISFFLCLLIYWITKEITHGRYPMAPFLAMSVYALVPMLLLPISLDRQVEVSSLDLALCFALPTLIIFIRKVQNRNKCPWFYIISGFTATAMTSLFMAILLLAPMFGFGVFYLWKRLGIKRLFSKSKVFLISFLGFIIVLYISVSYFEGIESFLLSQFYNVHAFSYYPFLIIPIEDLSVVYAAITIILIVYFLINGMKGSWKDELIFLGLFFMLILLNIPETGLKELLNIDIDQLNGLYAFMIAIFFGLLFMTVMELLAKIESFSPLCIKSIGGSLFVTVLAIIFYLQGGVQFSRLYPQTVPNGFFEAYYKIIDEHLPYSYSIVGPQIQRITAKNRHYFMSYSYFLDEYLSIDSLYHKKLRRDLPLSSQSVPPSSIFIFTEKQPYQSIQQSILYDSQSIMLKVKRWLKRYRKLPNRRVNIYYSDETATVYEIVNREESAINDILGNIYPSK